MVVLVDLHLEIGKVPEVVCITRPPRIFLELDSNHLAHGLVEPERITHSHLSAGPLLLHFEVIVSFAV